MAFVKKTHIDRDVQYKGRFVQYPELRKGEPDTSSPTTVWMSRSEGLVYQPGEKVNAVMMNDFEQRVENAFQEQELALSGIRTSVSQLSIGLKSVSDVADRAYSLASAAMPRSGGTFTGNINAVRVTFASSTGECGIFMGGDSNAWLDFRTTGKGVLFRDPLNDEYYKEVQAGSFVQVSDEHYKDNIQNIPMETILKYETLTPAMYNLKSDREKQFGFIARDVAKVDESLVSELGDSNGELGVDLYGMIAMQDAYIKYLATRIDKLERTVSGGEK